jgi:predicted DNA-binding transcriptional regulator AlpA
MTAALVIRAREVAALLGRSSGGFYAHQRELEAAGFPAKDALLGGWHRAAVEGWVAKRAGGVQSLALDVERDAMRGEIHAQAARRRHAVRHREAR